MDPVIKQRWIDDLRSAKYTQTKGALHRTVPAGDRGVGCCCLGVLCEQAADIGVIERVPFGTQLIGYMSTRNGRPYIEFSLLPPEVVHWAGLTTTVGLNLPDDDTNLSVLNDEGATFAELADVIEWHL